MRYKYLTKGEDADSEFWACDDCRKRNNHLILTGEWRLTDKSSDDNIVCEKCSDDGGNAEEYDQGEDDS